MRRARKACLVAAGACLLIAAAAPSSSSQEQDLVPPPEVFRGAASSLVASVQVDRGALIPVPELFKFILLDGTGQFEPDKQQARASLFFPGNGFILGPSLLCGTFGGQFPDFFKPLLDTCLRYKYPLTVFADSFEPDGATSGSLALGGANDPISGNAVRAVAHAGKEATTTDAAISDLRVLGVPPFGPITPQVPGFTMDTSLLTIDSAVSRTNQRIVKGGLVVDSEASLSGVRLFGGLIRIANLRSESHVTDDAKGKRTSTPKLVVSGLTVGGQPAQLTDEGIVLGSANSGPLDQDIQKALNLVLQSFNIRVTTLDSEKTLDKNGAAVAGVGGLLIEFERDVQGLPSIPGPLGQLDPNGVYTGSIQLGATAALGQAVNFGADEIDVNINDSDFPYSGNELPGDPGSVAFDPGDPGSFEPLIPSSSAGGAATPPATAGRTPSVERGLLARSLGGVFGDRLGMLYLALMFAVLSLCIAPALTVPARFGRSST